MEMDKCLANLSSFSPLIVLIERRCHSEQEMVVVKTFRSRSVECSF